MLRLIQAPHRAHTVYRPYEIWWSTDLFEHISNHIQNNRAIILQLLCMIHLPHPFFGCYFLKHEIYAVVQPFLKEYIISASV